MRISRRALFVAGMLAIFGAMEAQAGNKRMTHPSGKSVTISCTGMGCDIQYYDANGKHVKTEKTAGGRKNYYRNVARLKKMGYR